MVELCDWRIKILKFLFLENYKMGIDLILKSYWF